MTIEAKLDTIIEQNSRIINLLETIKNGGGDLTKGPIKIDPIPYSIPPTPSVPYPWWPQVTYTYTDTAANKN